MIQIDHLDLNRTKVLAAQLILSDVIRAISNANPGLDKSILAALTPTRGLGHKAGPHDPCSAQVVDGAIAQDKNSLLPDEVLSKDKKITHTLLGQLARSVVNRYSIFRFDPDLDRKFWQDFIRNQGAELIPYKLNREWLTKLPNNFKDLDLTAKRVHQMSDFYLMGGGYVAGKEYFDLIFCWAYKTVYLELLKHQA
jgi:hypothetical protein